jgi:hypothetical protein
MRLCLNKEYRTLRENLSLSDYGCLVCVSLDVK